MPAHFTASLVLFNAILAAARLTRLVTRDRITQAPREWALRRLPDGHLLAYLVMCDWCVSVYVGAVTATAWVVWGDERLFIGITAALAMSHVTGWLAAREES
ncbi:hypothetical protein [Streptomyces drozdowiczii]|uniref:DUF1360 domain-containing protein n=1 Tax=Streptomyces drozdowiczii TaxID=202862 RepID=A0ABY6PQP9_9ACTN|nr:hypothetical protein [Streptomyces drozdowiczii]MCX0246421.1 hypothetical protein [Streptomyces drozdowiczii]UZK54076.1 hypothetical protein NEH16_07850 [Streptomyces drozdowiczii]